ncbi:MAG: peptidoglycan-binding protein [Clostridia bacterium]
MSRQALSNKSRLWRGLCILCGAWLLCCALALPALSEAEKKGVVDASALIIRDAPSTKGEGLRTLKRGATVTILDTEGSWYKVQHGVIIGYVSKQYVKSASQGSKSAGASSEPMPKSIAAIGDAPKSTREGDSGSNVKKLQQALKLKGFYSGTCDGVYGTGTMGAVKAFQKSRKLTADGIAGNATIKYLFGATAETSEAGSGSKSAKSYKTEKPEWFKDGESLIQKGTVFYVKDVRTGIVFRVKRWSGYNHMDCEPYTAEDTALMKKAFGGAWTWNRRPLLILCNNRVFASSMNGMPHGTQTIANNNFEGHFCIHFAGSKTHGTQVVDSDHQAAVNEAAKATW